MWINFSSKLNFLPLLNGANILSWKNLMIWSHVTIHESSSVFFEIIFNSAIKSNRVRNESWFCLSHSGNLAAAFTIFIRLNTPLFFSCMFTSKYGVRSSQNCGISLFIWSELRSRVLISVNFDDVILRPCWMTEKSVDADKACFCDANSPNDTFVINEKRFSSRTNEMSVLVFSVSYHASTSNWTTQFTLPNT